MSRLCQVYISDFLNVAKGGVGRHRGLIFFKKSLFWGVQLFLIRENLLETHKCGGSNFYGGGERLSSIFYRNSTIFSRRFNNELIVCIFLFSRFPVTHVIFSTSFSVLLAWKGTLLVGYCCWWCYRFMQQCFEYSSFVAYYFMRKAWGK